MKASFIIVLFFLGNQAIAQKAELTLFSGYTFKEKMDVVGGTMRINGGHTYGTLFSYIPSTHYTLDFTFSRQDASADINTIETRRSLDMSVNYFLAGISRTGSFGRKQTTTWFAGPTIGIGLFDPENKAYHTKTKFSLGLKTGVKQQAGKYWGFRVQANLHIPIIDEGGNIITGPEGVDIGFSTTNAITQFGFTGGIYYIFRSTPGIRE